MIITRVVILWIMAAVKVSIISVEATEQFSEISQADLVYYIISLSKLLINIGIQIVFYKCKIFSSSVQFIYWLVHVICYIPTFKHDIDNFTIGVNLEVSGTKIMNTETSLNLKCLALMQTRPQWSIDAFQH